MVETASARGADRPVSTVRRVLTPAGLGLAVVGILLALWAFTGERSLDLAYFWIAVVGLALVLLGVVVAALGRALAPRGLTGKARRSPPAGVPARKAAAPAVPRKPAPSPPVTAIPPPTATPAEAAPAGAPLAAVAPVSAPPMLLRCPSCGSTFPPTPGSRTAVCPQCGAEGDVPEAP